ncbi:hypothetical protein ABIC83_002996 [Roseateles asaccharophilus]|uniref:hypothetical protein n=1 Tax=Roseateles asaccharophilus TaxID=582607 RepID=UPI003837FFD0
MAYLAWMQDQELLVNAAVRALVPLGRLVEVPGHSAGQPAQLHCHRLAKQLADATPGARVVSGWILEGVRRNGSNSAELRVVFDHHSVVRLPGGQLACPSTPRGGKIRFVEDPARPYDFGNLVGYNLAAFANHRLTGVIGAAIPAFTIAWMVPFCGSHIFSADRRRSQWTSFAWSDPFEFAASQGLDRSSVFDLAFASDLDAVMSGVSGLTEAGDGIELLTRVRAIQPLLRQPREL